MIKTVNSRWGKMVKAKVEIEVYALLPEGDNRDQIPDTEAVRRLRNELCTTSNSEIVEGAKFKLVNQL